MNDRRKYSIAVNCSSFVNHKGVYIRDMLTEWQDLKYLDLFPRSYMDFVILSDGSSTLVSDLVVSQLKS